MPGRPRALGRPRSSKAARRDQVDRRSPRPQAGAVAAFPAVLDTTTDIAQ